MHNNIDLLFQYCNQNLSPRQLSTFKSVVCVAPPTISEVEVQVCGFNAEAQLHLTDTDHEALTLREVNHTGKKVARVRNNNQ